MPPATLTPYRGADHVRCSHPTPSAAGFHPCQGDSGCEFRLKRRNFCSYHQELVYDLDPHRLYEELTGTQMSRVAVRAPWAA